MAFRPFKISLTNRRHGTINLRLNVPGEESTEVSAFSQFFTRQFFQAAGFDFPAVLSIEPRLVSNAPSEVEKESYLVWPGGEEFVIRLRSLEKTRPPFAMKRLNPIRRILSSARF